MSYPPPRQSALFTLKPLNERTVVAIKHFRNRHLLCQFSDGSLGLDIGPLLSSASRESLGTLGRGNCDVTIDDPRVSRLQCEFQVLKNGMIMLVDRSRLSSTRVSGPNCTPFEFGRKRQVVVLPEWNTEISMGGSDGSLLLFQMVWNEGEAQEKLKAHFGHFVGEEDNPSMARTMDDVEEERLNERVTRIHTPLKRLLKIRYTRCEVLGGGSFGTVFKAIDLDSGEFMALKVVSLEEQKVQITADGKVVDKLEEEAEWRRRTARRREILKREIENLANSPHPHIVRYIWHEELYHVKSMHIFTELMDGALSEIRYPISPEITTIVFHHILRALDFLSSKSLVHRDVKPANILYKETERGPIFQLGDFGFSNSITLAKTKCGSRLYMSPEVMKGGKQTPKLDVWSLGVTVIAITDTNGFYSRQNDLSSHEGIFEAVQLAAQQEQLRPIRDMMIPDVDSRASAGQLLQEFFGEGALPSTLSVLSAPSERYTVAEDGLGRANCHSELIIDEGISMNDALHTGFVSRAG